MSAMKTEFTEGLCETPSAAGNHAGLSGGYPIENVGPGGRGLVSSPYQDGICSTPSGGETRSSELGTTPTLTDVKDAPVGQPSGMSNCDMIERHVDGNATFKTPK